MKNVIRVVEYLSAGLLFVVMVIITSSAISRYFFNAPLLDGDDLARLLLLPAIFFGLAGACHHDEHVRVDMLWERLRAKGRRCVDLFAIGVTAIVIGTMGVAAVGRVMDIHGSGVGTYELRMPMWPYFALACVAILLTALILLSRWITALRWHAAASQRDAGEQP